LSISKFFRLPPWRKINHAFFSASDLSPFFHSSKALISLSPTKGLIMYDATP